MNNPKAHQLVTAIAHILMLVSTLMVTGIILSIGTDYWFIIVVGTVISLAALAVSLKPLKARLLDLAFTASTKWVNTAAGARPQEEGMHHPRPADGGVLKISSNLFHLPYLINMLTYIWVMQGITTISALILKLSGWSGFVPGELARRLQTGGLFERELGELVFNTVTLFIAIAVTKKRYELSKAPWSTVWTASLASGAIFGSSQTKFKHLTFIDPASGRVRRVYREHGESFEPAKAKVKGLALGQVRSQGA